MEEAHEKHLIGRLASVLASVHDVEPMASRLCEAGRRMLDADGAALTLMTSAESFVVIAATDELATRLEDLQDAVGEGPSKDAFRDSVVQVADFSAAVSDRWALMHEHGRSLGFEGAVVAVPLCPGRAVIGILTVYRRSGVSDQIGATAAFLSATIGAAVLHDPQFDRQEEIYSDGWKSRALIHQATGMIISQVGVRPEDAIALLRGQAFANGTSLIEVAEHVISRRINFRDFTIEGD